MKRILALILSVLMIATLASCSGSKETTADAQTTKAPETTTAPETTDTTAPETTEAPKSTVALETIAKALADKLGDYVAYQISQYSDYAAAQVPKLDKPVIVTKGCVVVYVISEDNAAAAEVVKGLIG